MKRKYSNRKAALNATIRIGCTAAICMMPSLTFAGSTEAPVVDVPAAEPDPATNWVDLTVGGAFVSGDDGAYKTRTQNGDFYGGISSMHWEKEANDITWTLDGHALFGNEDYEIILKAEKFGLGYVEAGFEQFRTWYDPSAGYMPRENLWYPDQDGELSLYRGELWFEAGLRMENLPEVTFRYTHGWRSGDKDSTVWGRPGAAGIAPAMYQIDEERNTFELDVAYTLGITDLGLGLRYESASNEDDRLMGSTTQTEIYESDLFSAHIFSTSRLNERMMLSFGYALTTLDTDIDGSSRISDPLAGHDWFGLSGGGEYQSQVANANFWWNPIDDLVIVPSLRAEWENQSAIASFDEIPRGLDDNYDTTEWVYLRDQSDTEYSSLTEQLDIRYSGIDNVLLYAKGVFNQEDNDVKYLSFDDGHEIGRRYKSSEVNEWKAAVGANWYPLTCLKFSSEYYHRGFDQDYDNRLDGYDAHIASHNISTDNFNIRMTWRALSNLTLVTRYDYQQSSYDTRGIDGDDLVLSEIQSADVTRNIISQSVTWMPIERAYIQGTASWIMAETDTDSHDRAPDVVSKSQNDYLTANLTVGYSLDQKTDITASYAYYYMNNYELPSNSVGYGTNLEEHVFSVRLNRQISPNMIWNLGYGYYTSNDGTYGGNNDFSANMVSTGLQVRF